MDNSDSDTDSEWVPSGSEASDHDTIESLHSDLSDEEHLNVEELYNTAPDGTVWQLDAPRAGQPPQRNLRNVNRQPQGPKSAAARNINTPKSSWELFFSPDTLDMILQHTNNHRATYLQGNQGHWTANIQIERRDIEAYIALRYYIGINRDQRMHMTALWSDEHGDAFCRAVMSRRLFATIHRFIRFDDHATRFERRVQDRFTSVRELYDNVSNTFSLHWTPETHVTVDEQIASYRGRCPIKIYDASKPDKYGIKIYMLCDSNTHYVLSMEPYVRGENVPHGHYSGSSIFQRLVSNSDLPRGIGVCADNFFMDVSLVDWCNDRHLSVLGTVRNNRRSVPPSMRKENLRGNPEQYTRFVYRERCSLVAYIPQRHAERKFKTVLCLSSEHMQGNTDDETGKPESIMAYNMYKAGVDILSWCVKEYTVKKKNRRWTMRVFEQLLDVSAYNAWIIFRHNYPLQYPALRRGGRKLFIRVLAKELAHASMERRIANRDGLQQPILKCLATFGYIPPAPEGPAADNLRRVCHLCPAARKRKSKQLCSRCNNTVCGEHSIANRICERCNNLRQ